jgi:hypothetical protein
MIGRVHDVLKALDEMEFSVFVEPLRIGLGRKVNHAALIL